MQAHAQRPRFKICCIKSVAEARTTFARGAAALGLASHMPSGPGIIAESLIAEIAAAVARLGPRRTRRRHIANQAIGPRWARSTAHLPSFHLLWPKSGTV
jgi:hypothetical protein